jgi:sec-independent protein translocase protein TatA
MTALVMGLPGGMEWVILLIVALLLFGGQRIAGMGKGAGRAIREFKEEIKAPTGVDASQGAAATDTSTPVNVENATPEPPKQS